MLYSDEEYMSIWKCDDADVFMHSYALQGEGLWCDAYVYMDTKGVIYEVWVDQDGDSKVVSCV